ncbi:DUF424 family protein [archaeon]|nr:DUF424 family protein [archaeon]
MYAKLHEIQGKSVLAACDKELIGKELMHGEAKIRISEVFYKGEIVSEKELLALLDEANNINLFGSKCINAAVKKGFISEKEVLLVGGKVPHAQIYRL